MNIEFRPLFEFIVYGLVFVSAYVLTLGFWLLIEYVYDRVKR